MHPQHIIVGGFHGGAGSGGIKSPILDESVCGPGDHGGREGDMGDAQQACGEALRPEICGGSKRVQG